MKKLIVGLSALSIATGTVLNVVSCNIGEFSTRKYLESLNDFNWESEQVDDGDGFNWKYNEYNDGTKYLDLKEVDSAQGPVDKIFDYDKYSTSYKGANFIKKQATTGSPVIKSYRPNGNMWSDYGLSSKSRKYLHINSIQEWNNGKDMDLDYNIASTDLRGRNYVAKNSVNGQQKETFFNMFHDPSNSSSSIVGTKNPFGGNLTNLSYIHEMYTWPAITNKGWLTTSFADYTDYMHKNGVPVLGLWYMSGWEDLTRESLRKLLEKNSNGEFKIVDILIDQCLKYNFDGWMINNEANGSQGDGYVIKNSEINEIMKEFSKRADELEPKIGKKLHIVHYTNDGSLTYDPINNTPNSKKTIEAAKYASEMQLDFTYDNNVSNYDKYLENIWKGDNSKRKTIYSLLNESTNIPGVGNYDVRNLIFEKKQSENAFDFSSTANNSFSIFGSGGANEYAKDFKNWFNRKQKETGNYVDKYKVLLMQQEVSNLYSNYQFFGTNGYLDNSARGYDKLISQNQQNISAIYQSDPRLSYKDFDKRNDWNESVQENFMLKENGQKTKSYGIGNSFWEKTVVADSVLSNDYSTLDKNVANEIENDPTIETYFSTGSGIQYLNRDQNKNIINNQIYPWTNSRMADVAPTYQWDFWSEKQNDSTVEIETADGKKNVSKITPYGQLTGYYDYYDAYQKGNSLAIGMGYDFDKEGTVKPGIWKNNSYYWNIMGTNLQKNSYTASFYVKSTLEDSNEKSSNEKISEIAKNTKITAFTSKLSEQEVDARPEVLKTNVEYQKDGWYKISSDLSELNNIGKEERIAKIGVQINPGQDDSDAEKQFIFNVGGFTLEKNQVGKFDLPIKDAISKIQNDYIVKRKNKNNINIRFSWNDQNKSLVDYYHIYYSTDKDSWYRVGQTSQNKYYVREIDESDNQKIYIGVQPRYKNGKMGKISFVEFDTKYNYEK
ncbi:hypothetical protein CXP39_03605 [Mesoplasma syrphidae]|uniref:Cytosolic endo-beta-N-acetylglucosaminidase TIM barrel domain-containing protein n=1 Tax=Mesoplasma syrphidae TaxID=225999 RepID=A0A2K9BVV5_9MOLU|nr:hypothetical protein [Mesoplasma syrphidae]AUF83850.1 hypothetical protein CXP39_03605 [Mesoplasma syrphidae]